MCLCSDGGSDLDKKRLVTNVPTCSFTFKPSLVFALDILTV